MNDWKLLDPLLIELWADFTISAREIGERLGVTKNAVIGRTHRLHLAKRRMGFQPKGLSKPRKPRNPNMGITVQKPVPKNPMLREPPKRDRFGHFISAKSAKSAKSAAEKLPPWVDRPVTILELNGNTCRWPLGEPPFLVYCGRPPFDQSVYCKEHFRLAYTGKAPRSVGRNISAGRRF